MGKIMLPIDESTIVRSWAETDLEGLVCQADNSRVRAGLRDRFPHPYTSEDGRNFLCGFACAAEETLFAIVVDGMVAGGIGVEPLSGDREGVFELGYWLGEEFWGRGIMTRVVAAVTGYAFEHLGAQRVVAEFFPWNLGSRRVLEKSGFRHEGTHRQAIRKAGTWVDMECYARVRGEA